MAKRDYKNELPSVTTVLGILRKIGLEMWFKYNTAQFCKEESEKGKEIGTQIHEAIQSHIEEKEVKVETQYAEEVMTALKSFMLFKKEHPEIKLYKSEIVLTSKRYGYNGTLDCLGNDGIPVIVDWKSGKCKKKDTPPIYDEAIYQVSAYVEAYNEQAPTNVGRAYVLAFAKDKVAYNMRLVESNELTGAFKKVFLPCLSIFKYQKGVE